MPLCLRGSKTKTFLIPTFLTISSQPLQPIVRNLVAILLFICLFFTVLGYHFIFYVQLTSAKAEMQKILPHIKDNAHITEFHLSAEEAQNLNWDDDNEFSYKGQMYDVIEKKIQNGALVIKCISDKNETALLDNYLSNQRNTSGNQPVSYLLKIVTNAFVRSSIICPAIPEKNLQTQFLPYYSPTSFINFPVLTQPPKIG